MKAVDEFIGFCLDEEQEHPSKINPIDEGSETHSNFLANEYIVDNKDSSVNTWEYFKDTPKSLIKSTKNIICLC